MSSLFEPTNQETTLGGRYKIISQLGAGGFGHTFLAQDLHLPGSPRCVVKQLKPKSREEENLKIARRLFDTEANVLAQLGSHNQIPRLLAHFEENREFYLILELIEGESLTQDIVSGQPWSEAEVKNLLQDVLQVLSFVHEQQVIHRDIKPSNLIRRHSDGRIVLIDFGAVKQVSTQIITSLSEQSSTICIGTAGYMANEQLAGHPHFSSDIYGVGVLGIQALTGLHPKNFSIDVRTSEILWHDRAPDVSPQFKAFLDRMVRYDFRDRYPTAKEALETLQNLSRISLEPPHPVHSQELNGHSTHPQEVYQSSVPVTVPQVTQRQSLRRKLLPNQKQPFNPWPIFSVLASVVVTFTLTKTFLPTVIEKTIYQFIHLSGESSTERPDSQATPSLLGSPSLDLTFPSPSPTPSPRAIDPAFAASLAKLSLPQLLSEANRLRQAGKYQEALVAYDQAITRNSTIPEAHWGRCYSLNKLQNSKDALSACDRALVLKPNYPEALSSKGYALERQKNYQQAFQSAEQAIKLNPKFAEAWTNQGVALLEMNRPTEALKAFEQATTLKPNYAEAWANRGAALWRLKRYDDALASLDKALQIQPNYKNAINLRQQALTQLDNLPQD